MEGEALGGESDGSRAQGCMVLFAAPPAPTPNTPGYSHATQNPVRSPPRASRFGHVLCLVFEARWGRASISFPYAVLCLLCVRARMAQGTGPDWSSLDRDSF
jgi:hypothetical protein